jgi:DNA helicase MCM9
MCTWLLQGFWQHHASAPLVGRNAIIASICPQLHGMFAIKLALLLMLIGGLTRVSDTGMHIRGDIHMLLVGDPGTGQCAAGNPKLGLGWISSAVI